MYSEKKIYNLEIDEEFKKLIPPLSAEELSLLEENIIRDGCREPLCVWNNIIVDGHNRYNICIKNNIPFNVQTIEFNNREEIITWICVNQLGRRNISAETRRYLIGKRYQMEKILLKNPIGKNQYSQIYETNMNLKEERQKGHRSLTSVRLSKEYQISSRTVMDYGNYANSLDILEKRNPELVSKVLKGEIKIGQKNIIKLSKMPPQMKKYEKYIYPSTRPKSELNKDKFSEQKITIKDMPKFDPDAEVVSLSCTIPSWIGSIDRVLGKINVNQITEEAKLKLKKELENLNFSVHTLILALEGE